MEIIWLGYIVYKFSELPSNNLGIYAVKTQFLPRFSRNLTTIIIRHVGVLKRIVRSQFWFPISQGATNFVKKWQTLPICRSGIPKRNEIRINSVYDVSISFRNFVNFGRVTPELTEFICELLVRYGKKLEYLVEYFRIYWTDFRNLFTIWTRLDADDRLGPCSPICQGTLPRQPNNIWRSNERGLILPAFFALAFENELECHYLYVHINSNDDHATSSINLVSFWPVPPELTQINCVEQASFSTRVCLSTFARC